MVAAMLADYVRDGQISAEAKAATRPPLARLAYLRPRYVAPPRVTAGLRYLLRELGERRAETAARAPDAWRRLAASSTVAPLDAGRVVRRRGKPPPRHRGAWGRLERASLRR